MEWLAYVAFGFLGLRAIIALANYLTASLPVKAGKPGEPIISVIVPVRNEEKNIGKLLRQLLENGYRHYEIIVYDDLSEDNTAEIVKDIAREDQRIRLVEGVELPEGWLGKSHACHQAAQQARGGLLLFLDADVEVRDDLLFRAVRSFRKLEPDLLSIFPVQKMKSPGEWLTVPLMNWILVSLLPLSLTPGSRLKALSAANGQFMLFNGSTYRKHLFHEKVKQNMVEDIAIVKYMKERGLKVHTFLSRGEISCRMYRSYSGAIRGFSKNIVEIFGNSPLMLLLYLLFTNFGIITVLLFLPSYWILIYLAVFIVMRSLVSLASRQNVMINLFLSPFQQISLNLIALSALRYRLFGGLSWKGRRI